MLGKKWPLWMKILIVVGILIVIVIIVLVIIVKNFTKGCKVYGNSLPYPDNSSDKFYKERYGLYVLSKMVSALRTNDPLRLKNTKFLMQLGTTDSPLFGSFVFNKKDKKYYLVYRGAALKSDWGETSFKIKLVPYNNLSDVRVHKGFYEFFNNMRHSIDEIMKSYPKITLNIVGMSLGTPIACFTQLYLLERYRKKSNCYIIGAPRMGNYKFIQYLDSMVSPKNLKIILNTKDIFSKLPTKSKLFAGKLDTYTPYSNNYIHYFTYDSGIECLNHLPISYYNEMK